MLIVAFIRVMFEEKMLVPILFTMNTPTGFTKVQQDP